MRRALAHVLASGIFAAGKVHAPIVGGSSSLALEPLRLHGARVTIVENEEYKLTCSYTAADGSVVTFNGRDTVRWAVRNAGLKGVVWVDKEKGPAEPLPKPRDAEGREADIWLCVPGAAPFATAAKGLAFVLLTQPRDDSVAWTSMPKEVRPVKGDRVISLRVDKDHTDTLNLQKKPPKAGLGFCEGPDETPGDECITCMCMLA